MQELIKIQKRGNKNLVNARELHHFLIKDAKGGQIGRQFNHWIKEAIEKYGFIENEDFVVFEYDYKGNVIAKNGQSDNQRVSKRDYGLTIGMAKELSMVQNNDKGREARKYFIECEKQLRQQSSIQSQLPQDYLSALKALVETEEQKQKALEQAKEYKQLAIEASNHAEDLADQRDKALDENFELERVSRLLERIEGDISVKIFSSETYSLFKMGQNQIFSFLRENKVIMYKWNGYCSENYPYQKYIDNGWLKIKSGTHWDPKNLIDRMHHNIVITPKGRVWLVKFIANKLKQQQNA